MSKEKLSDVLSAIIIDRLFMYNGKTLTNSVCTEIYTVIFNVIADTFSKQKQIKLSNESINFVAQMYYDSISINGSSNTELNPNIFTQRATLDNIPTNEIAFLAVAFNETPFASPFIYTLKNRN